MFSVCLCFLWWAFPRGLEIYLILLDVNIGCYRYYHLLTVCFIFLFIISFRIILFSFFRSLYYCSFPDLHYLVFHLKYNSMPFVIFGLGSLVLEMHHPFCCVLGMHHPVWKSLFWKEAFCLIKTWNFSYILLLYRFSITMVIKRYWIWEKKLLNLSPSQRRWVTAFFHFATFA